MPPTTPQSPPTSQVGLVDRSTAAAEVDRKQIEIQRAYALGHLKGTPLNEDGSNLRFVDDEFRRFVKDDAKSLHHSPTFDATWINDDLTRGPVAQAEGALIDAAARRGRWTDEEYIRYFQKHPHESNYTHKLSGDTPEIKKILDGPAALDFKRNPTHADVREMFLVAKLRDAARMVIQAERTGDNPLESLYRSPARHKEIREKAIEKVSIRSIVSSDTFMVDLGEPTRQIRRATYTLPYAALLGPHTWDTIAEKAF